MPVLTKTLVENLTPLEKDFITWDIKISGFGVKTTPTGRKVYLLKYRALDGRQRKPSIGVHGNITCENARKIAEQWHGKIANQEDPLKNSDLIKSSPNMSDLCDRFMKDHAKVRKKKLGIELDQSVIDKYIKPKLGDLKVVSVCKEDIQKFHLNLQYIPSHANRILRVLSKMFNLAEDWNLRPNNSNPVKNVERFKENPRERYLSPFELDKLQETLSDCLKDKTESIYVLSLVRLLLLTGARLREIMHAKWEWVDFEKNIIALPDSKTGKKTIYLSPNTIEILRETPRVADNPYIIIGAVEKSPLISPQKPWKRIKERANFKILKETNTLFKQCKNYQEIEEYCTKKAIEVPLGIMDVRLHDLRHTYASICVTNGMSLQMVSKLLGHARASTSERYAHLAHDPISIAASQIDNFMVGVKNDR